jgi:hypothetical protein
MKEVKLGATIMRAMNAWMMNDLEIISDSTRELDVPNQSRKGANASRHVGAFTANYQTVSRLNEKKKVAPPT